MFGTAVCLGAQSMTEIHQEGGSGSPTHTLKKLNSASVRSFWLPRNERKNKLHAVGLKSSVLELYEHFVKVLVFFSS